MDEVLEDMTIDYENLIQAYMGVMHLMQLIKIRNKRVYSLYE